MNSFLRTYSLLPATIIMSVFFAAKAETINLKGTIIDNNSAAIGGAKVRLQKAGIELLTDKNGNFHFLNSTAISLKKNPALIERLAVAFCNGHVDLAIDKVSPVKIDLITISGKRAGSIMDRTLYNGYYRIGAIPPGICSHQLMLLRVTIGSDRYLAMSMPSLKSRYAINTSGVITVLNPTEGGLGKNQLAAIDSLSIQRAGSITKQVPVMNYIDSLGRIILMGQQTRLIQNLLAGKRQTIVYYGTSLTASGAWVNHLGDTLSKRFPGLVGANNSGMSGLSSWEGVAQLRSKVIANTPTAVFIEFAVNDAYIGSYGGNYLYCTLAQSKDNLNKMIDSILAALPTCEIIPMTMNIPTGTEATIRPGLENYYEVYRQVARDRGFVYVDNYASWKAIYDSNPTLYQSYLSDLIHPNPTGSLAVTAPRVERTVFEGQIQPY